MLLDKFNTPIKVGDTVVTAEFELGTALRCGQYTVQVHTPGWIQSLHARGVVSISPVAVVPESPSRQQLTDKLSRKVQISDKVLYLKAGVGVRMGYVLRMDYSNKRLDVSAGLGYVIMNSSDVIVINERIEYIKEQYPELLL